ncbi:MAG: hypothetical protein JWL64_2104 [Frankiales bacterium]|nr:hypothetical protein [Frankiales bacterium]
MKIPVHDGPGNTRWPDLTGPADVVVRADSGVGAPKPVLHR